MQLLIAVWNRGPWYKSRIGRSRNIAVEVNNDDTVGDVVNQLSARLGIPCSNLFLVLCGKKLTNDARINTLFLGPQT